MHAEFHPVVKQPCFFLRGTLARPRGGSAGLQPPGPLPYNIEEELSDFWKRACIARRLGDWFGAGVALGWCYRLDNAFDVEASMQGFAKLINLAFDAGGEGGSEPLRGQALVGVTEKTKTSAQGAECLQVRSCLR